MYESLMQVGLGTKKELLFIIQLKNCPFFHSQSEERSSASPPSSLLFLPLLFLGIFWSVQQEVGSYTTLIFLLLQLKSVLQLHKHHDLLLCDSFQVFVFRGHREHLCTSNIQHSLAMKDTGIQWQKGKDTIFNDRRQVGGEVRWHKPNLSSSHDTLLSLDLIVPIVQIIPPDFVGVDKHKGCIYIVGSKTLSQPGTKTPI